MSTNEQPHAPTPLREIMKSVQAKALESEAAQPLAPVTEKMRHLAIDIHSYKDIDICAQLLTNFCAKREAELQRRVIEQSERLQELAEHICLLTASNEDLTTQVVKLTEEKSKWMEASIDWQKRSDDASKNRNILRDTAHEIALEYDGLQVKHNDLRQLATRLAKELEGNVNHDHLNFYLTSQQALADARKANLLPNYHAPSHPRRSHRQS